jgi:trans-aconitate 2-methyltransferase
MNQERRNATGWDPSQYLKFGDHRLRPGLELLARITTESPRLVYDLGCGTGNLTRLIADRWSDARVVGLDSSTDMLSKARSDPGSMEWIEADIRTWQPEERPDVIYSNATLQWVDGHDEVFPQLVSCLAPDGVMAVQMPLSWGMPSHQLMRETMAGGGPDGQPFGTETLRLATGRKWVDEAEEYYDLLVGRTASVDIWETEYNQILEGDDAVLEWVRGTGLRPILEGLDDIEREQFLAIYSSRLREAYPKKADGRTLYPFRRLFIVVTV